MDSRIYRRIDNDGKVTAFNRDELIRRLYCDCLDPELAWQQIDAGEEVRTAWATYIKAKP